MDTFLYYDPTVNYTILVSLNSIAVEQANITEATDKSVTEMLNYAATHYLRLSDTKKQSSCKLMSLLAWLGFNNLDHPCRGVNLQHLIP